MVGPFYSPCSCCIYICAEPIISNMAKSPFTIIPGVGPSIADDLERLGFVDVDQLRNQDPQKMYDDLMKLEGTHVDRCILYVFRCAVYYSKTKNPDPDKLLWWNWKDS